MQNYILGVFICMCPQPHKSKRIDIFNYKKTPTTQITSALRSQTFKTLNPMSKTKTTIIRHKYGYRVTVLHTKDVPFHSKLLSAPYVYIYVWAIIQNVGNSECLTSQFP